MLGVPIIPDVTLQIPDDHLSLIHLMSNHVTIRVPGFPKRYLHTNSATVVATKYLTDSDTSLLDIEKAVDIIIKEFAKENTIRYKDLVCPCRGHVLLPSLNFHLKVLLCQLQELDVTEDLKDQTGAQYLVSLVQYISIVHKLEITCSCKGASLQTSCVVLDTTTNEVHPLNSTPDFIFKSIGGGSRTIGIGEMESSPFKQMVVAGLGHIGEPYIKYILGMCLSKARTIDMYLFESDLSVKIHCDEMYTGAISLKKLTTEPFYITKQDCLKRFMSKLVSVLKFIIKRGLPIWTWKPTCNPLSIHHL